MKPAKCAAVSQLISVGQPQVMLAVPPRPAARAVVAWRRQYKRVSTVEGRRRIGSWFSLRNGPPARSVPPGPRGTVRPRPSWKDCGKRAERQRIGPAALRRDRFRGPLRNQAGRLASDLGHRGDQPGDVVMQDAAPQVAVKVHQSGRRHRGGGDGAQRASAGEAGQAQAGFSSASSDVSSACHALAVGGGGSLAGPLTPASHSIRCSAETRLANDLIVSPGAFGGARNRCALSQAMSQGMVAVMTSARCACSRRPAPCHAAVCAIRAAVRIWLAKILRLASVQWLQPLSRSCNAPGFRRREGRGCVEPIGRQRGGRQGFNRRNTGHNRLYGHGWTGLEIM